MKKAKHIRCQHCGDSLLSTDAIDRLCPECHQRSTRPPEGAQVAREFTCADCGARFILATGELVAHRDTRYCVTCWRAQRYTTRITLGKDKQPIESREAIRTSVPLWAIEVGVDWPCTFDDLKQRGREIRKAYHPDLGGDHAMFIIKNGYYEQGLAWFAQQGTEVAV